MQFQVMVSNGGLMPVESYYSGEIDEEHFAFKNKEEIKFYWYADIIGIGNYKASLGDLFMITGISLVIGFFVTYNVMVWRAWKNGKTR